MRSGRGARSGGGRGVFVGEGLEPRCLSSALPAGFSETLVAESLQSPSALAMAPDGRVFVAEQAGVVKVVKDGALLPAPLLTVPANSEGERGLLGITLDPHFDQNGFVYVFYTAAGPEVHNRVSRFTVEGDTASPASEQPLLDMPPIVNRFHMGGSLAFGPDGMLYVGVGDHTRGSNAQSMDVLMGKVLRLAPDGSIPTDNPFYATATGDNRAIWALGLRNPYTMTFEPSTGRLFINDVGEKTFEEINDGVAGANYGWPATEGETTTPGFQSPLYAYPGESVGTEVCVIGGAFYEGTPQQFPTQYNGLYFFADYSQGFIHTIDPATKQVGEFATGVSFPTALGLAPDGSVYYLARGADSGGQPLTGGLYRVAFTATVPTVTSQPGAVSVASGQPATFTVGATGDAPLAYQWQRNGVDIPGATEATYTLPTATTADNGATFAARVSNAFGSTTSAAAVLTVVPPVGQPPAGGTVLEAERAKAIGVTRVKVKTRFTGEGFVIFSGAGQAATLTLQAAKAGTARVAIRYAHGEAGPVTLNVTVNGVPAAPLLLRPTGNSNTWKTAALKLPLAAGANEVTLESATAGELHVDSLKLGRTLVEAETATLAGATANLSPTLPTGTGFVELRSRKPGVQAPTIEWIAQVPVEGAYDLSIRYANNTATTQPGQIVDTTSGQTGTVTLVPTATGSDWQYATVTMPLTAGPHTLRLTLDAPSGTLIDSLTVSPAAG